MGKIRDMPKSTSGPVVFASILAGLVLGLFIGAYVVYAWAPADAILQDASPRLLAYDGANPQYRDTYAAAVANRYTLARDRNRALRDAADMLGVTSGDLTVAQAVDMLNSARTVIAAENRAQGANSRFTAQDEIQLGTLSSDLSRQGAALAVAASPLSMLNQNGRLIPRIIGFILLLLLLLLAFLLIKWLGARADRQAAQAAGYAQPTGDINIHADNVVVGDRATLGADALDDFEVEDVDDDEPLAPPTLGAIRPMPPTVVAAASPPSASASTAATAAGAAAAAAAATTLVPPTVVSQPAPMAGVPGARPLIAFAPATYDFATASSDAYEEDYQIAGTLGELLGECGISVAEKAAEIENNEPNRRVSALSLWVFDKQSFNNTTKVLTTEAAANDPVTRARLVARGEPVIAREGGVVEVITSTLKVEAQISDLRLDASGQYFDKVTVTYNVQRR